MNKIYKHKYNTDTNSLVVVSELANNTIASYDKTSVISQPQISSLNLSLYQPTPVTKHLVHYGLMASMILGLAGLNYQASAADLTSIYGTHGQLGSVVSGTATSVTNGLVTTIKNSPNAIINWQSFNINQDELLKFVQQTADSAVLNRVVGGDVSKILGSLQSNGQVFVINPNGIIFGKNSHVNVGGLVASTLDLNNQDFLHGRYVFNQDKDHEIAQVLNSGVIKVNADGSLALIGGQVLNNGVLEARNGTVYLLAGQSIEIADLNNPQISYKVTAQNKAVNLGRVFGKNAVLLGNKVLNGQDRYTTFADVIGSTKVNANQAEINANGQVVLFGGSEANQLQSSAQTNSQVRGQRNALVVNNGVINTTSKTGKVGKLAVLSDYVYLGSNSYITANTSADVGQAGVVAIGGDSLGKGQVKLAQAVYTDANQTIDVSASGAHSTAGQALIYGEHAFVDGTYNVSSANQGGVLETSATDLQISPKVNIKLGANPQAQVKGNWIIDPAALEIGQADTGSIDDVKPYGVTVDAVKPITGDGATYKSGNTYTFPGASDSDAASQHYLYYWKATDFQTAVSSLTTNGEVADLTLVADSLILIKGYNLQSQSSPTPVKFSNLHLIVDNTSAPSVDAKGVYLVDTEFNFGNLYIGNTNSKLGVGGLHLNNSTLNLAGDPTQSSNVEIYSKTGTPASLELANGSKVYVNGCLSAPGENINVDIKDNSALLLSNSTGTDIDLFKDQLHTFNLSDGGLVAALGANLTIAAKDQVNIGNASATEADGDSIKAGNLYTTKNNSTIIADNVNIKAKTVNVHGQVFVDTFADLVSVKDKHPHLYPANPFPINASHPNSYAPSTPEDISKDPSYQAFGVHELQSDLNTFYNIDLRKYVYPAYRLYYFQKYYQPESYTKNVVITGTDGVNLTSNLYMFGNLTVNSEKTVNINGFTNKSQTFGLDAALVWDGLYKVAAHNITVHATDININHTFVKAHEQLDLCASNNLSINETKFFDFYNSSIVAGATDASTGNITINNTTFAQSMLIVLNSTFHKDYGHRFNVNITAAKDISIKNTENDDVQESSKGIYYWYPKAENDSYINIQPYRSEIDAIYFVNITASHGSIDLNSTNLSNLFNTTAHAGKDIKLYNSSITSGLVKSDHGNINLYNSHIVGGLSGNDERRFDRNTENLAIIAKEGSVRLDPVFNKKYLLDPSYKYNPYDPSGVGANNNVSITAAGDITLNYSGVSAQHVVITNTKPESKVTLTKGSVYARDWRGDFISEDKKIDITINSQSDITSANSSIFIDHNVADGFSHDYYSVPKPLQNDNVTADIKLVSVNGGLNITLGSVKIDNTFNSNISVTTKKDAVINNATVATTGVKKSKFIVRIPNPNITYYPAADDKGHISITSTDGKVQANKANVTTITHSKSQIETYDTSTKTLKYVDDTKPNTSFGDTSTGKIDFDGNKGIELVGGTSVKAKTAVHGHAASGQVVIGDADKKVARTEIRADEGSVVFSIDAKRIPDHTGKTGADAVINNADLKGKNIAITTSGDIEVTPGANLDVTCSTLNLTADSLAVRHNTLSAPDLVTLNATTKGIGSIDLDHVNVVSKVIDAHAVKDINATNSVFGNGNHSSISLRTDIGDINSIDNTYNNKERINIDAGNHNNLVQNNSGDVSNFNLKGKDVSITSPDHDLHLHDLSIDARNNTDLNSDKNTNLDGVNIHSDNDTNINTKGNLVRNHANISSGHNTNINTQGTDNAVGGKTSAGNDVNIHATGDLHLDGHAIDAGQNINVGTDSNSDIDHQSNIVSGKHTEIDAKGYNHIHNSTITNKGGDATLTGDDVYVADSETNGMNLDVHGVTVCVVRSDVTVSQDTNMTASEHICLRHNKIKSGHDVKVSSPTGIELVGNDIKAQHTNTISTKTGKGLVTVTDNDFSGIHTYINRHTPNKVIDGETNHNTTGDILYWDNRTDKFSFNPQPAQHEDSNLIATDPGRYTYVSVLSSDGKHKFSKTGVNTNFISACPVLVDNVMHKYGIPSAALQRVGLQDKYHIADSDMYTLYSCNVYTLSKFNNTDPNAVPPGINLGTSLHGNVQAAPDSDLGYKVSYDELTHTFSH